MPSVKDIIKNIPKTQKDEQSTEDLMLDAEYLRESSAIISEALKKGFDVLQLENGDIVTTGTKVVVTQYHWDSKKGEMVKLSARTRDQSQPANKKKK